MHPIYQHICFKPNYNAGILKGKRVFSKILVVQWEENYRSKQQAKCSN